MKHLVIDARWYGPKHTGIGRYTQNLILELIKIKDFQKNIKLTLLIHPEDKKNIQSELGLDINFVTTNITHYSFLDQIITPFILYHLQPDLVHFTHIDKPILYFSKSVVTIHDLIKNFSTGPETTTKNIGIYWIKQFAYLLNSWFSIKFNSLIVPSNYWKNYLISHYHLLASQVTTTHEAVDPKFLKLKTKNYQLRTKNYLLYTGNLYPHKNLDVVLQTLTKLPNLKLKIISKPSVFLDRLKATIQELHLQKQVEFLGFVPDNDFQKIYQEALAFVFPSLMEGFGLPPLEAMSLDCPVISSNSSCSPEIYQQAVLYFNPKDPDDLVKQINLLTTKPSLRQQLIANGYQQVKKYSWSKTAKQTLAVYKKLLNTN
ncbi:MAG: glycosyltransferase family 1 protein [Candidatus Shapirobacteria bacterium]|jgi:glycosyltransferase involved in cell wall biosynthesis